MTTLPNLTPCPKPDCNAPSTHWHGYGGYVFACRFILNGKPCQHVDGINPCYAPRATAPLHLPDVDAVARAIYESDYNTNWDGASEDVKDSYRANAQAVLDLIAAHQPVWQRVEPGTLIKEGTRYRCEYGNGDAYERIAAGDFLTGDGVYSIDPRTVPAEPEDPRVALLLDWYVDAEPSGVNADDARDLLARLDAMGGEGR